MGTARFGPLLCELVQCLRGAAQPFLSHASPLFLTLPALGMSELRTVRQSSSSLNSGKPSIGLLTKWAAPGAIGLLPSWLESLTPPVQRAGFGFAASFIQPKEHRHVDEKIGHSKGTGCNTGNTGKKARAKGSDNRRQKDAAA